MFGVAVALDLVLGSDRVELGEVVGVSSMSAAAAFSWIRSRRRVPGMGTIHGF